MIVVADSSPLIILAKLHCFNLLNKLYAHLYISAEIHNEVVVLGAGLPGAQEVAASDWIDVKHLQDRKALLAAQSKYGLGVGELSTILLGKEIQADAVILDDYKAGNLQSCKEFRFAALSEFLKLFIAEETWPIFAPLFSSFWRMMSTLTGGCLTAGSNLLGCH